MASSKETKIYTVKEFKELYANFISNFQLSA